MKFIGNTNEFIHLETIGEKNCHLLNEKIESGLTILWFTEDQNQLIIDGEAYNFNKNQIVFLTEFHRINIDCISNCRFLRFNRPFYCILDNDVEVGCKGMLFFGASSLPCLSITAEEIETFEILWKMFNIEMNSNDALQIDMLQMMLKRYLILCARLYKSQYPIPKEKAQQDLIREFNFLVEQHFRSKHTVAEYAELLNKSPKTLSNVFSKEGFKTPIQYIHDRKVLEAKRLLHHSDLQVQEVAYQLGYDDIQSFSRFFKNQVQISPSQFKEKAHRE